jgi:hypothetical protein
MGNFNCITTESSCISPIGQLKLGTLASSCCKQVQAEIHSPIALELEDKITIAVEGVIKEKTEALMDKELKVLGVNPINVLLT